MRENGLHFEDRLSVGIKSPKFSSQKNFFRVFLCLWLDFDEVYTFIMSKYEIFENWARYRRFASSNR